MKLGTISITVLMAAFIVGCTDQSSLMNPQAEQKQSSNQLGKHGYDVSIDRFVIGPIGQKFHVTGTIPFSLAIKGDDCYVQTFVNLTVNESGTEREWQAVGGSYFTSTLDPQHEAVASETLALRADHELVSYIIVIEYSIKASGVAVTDMMIYDSPRTGAVLY